MQPDRSPVQVARAASTLASTQAVNRFHDPVTRVIVVHPTPGRGGEGIARDVLQAVGKRFRDRTPRDPVRLQTLASVWLHAELVRELVVVAADRQPAGDWVVLREICFRARVWLTLVVEQRPSRNQRTALGQDVRELSLVELIAELPPPIGPDRPIFFDYENRSPDGHPGFPPVPDVDFAFFPSTCIDVLGEDAAARVLCAFERGRAATSLWFDLRRTIEGRYGRSPRHAHAFLDTLVAPCATVDGAITMLRGAQAAFLLDGTLLEIDADAFAADHEAHAGAPATDATATLLRSYPEPHLAAAAALASATRANAEQLAELTPGSFYRAYATFASGHRLNPPFRPLLDAQILARHETGADDTEPLFLTTDNTRPATSRQIRNWLARIARETGLRFDDNSGWNRYSTPAWATFHQLANPPLIAR